MIVAFSILVVWAGLCWLAWWDLGRVRDRMMREEVLDELLDDESEAA